MRHTRSRGKRSGESLAILYVSAKGHERTHEVSSCGRYVRSKITGRVLKRSHTGKVFIHPAKKWVPVDDLVVTAATAATVLTATNVLSAAALAVATLAGAVVLAEWASGGSLSSSVPMRGPVFGIDWTPNVDHIWELLM